MASLFNMVMFALNPRGVSREMASLVPNKSIAKDACGIAFTTYHHFDGHCLRLHSKHPFAELPSFAGSGALAFDRNRSMSLLEQTEGQAGSKARNSGSKEGRGNLVVSTRSSSHQEEISSPTVRRKATASCTSLMASSFAERDHRNTTKKSSSPPGQGVESSLFRLDGDDDVRPADHGHYKQESPMSSKFANIPIGNTNSPNDGAPVVPRRSSDPYLYRDISGDVHVARYHDGSTDQLLHVGATNLVRSEKESIRTSKTTRRSFGFEGVVLECLTIGPFDDGMDSDLTRSDVEDDDAPDSVDRGQSGASSRRGSRELFKSSPRIKTKRHPRNQGKGDLPIDESPMSPSEIRRSRILSEDSSKMEQSGSPSTARISVGTGGTRVLSSKGRGSSPGRRRSSGRMECRWSVTSGTREDSLDEMLKTPRRSYHGDMLQPIIKNLPCKNKELEDTTEMLVASKDDEGDASKFQFSSPAPKSASWNDVLDNRAPSTTRPTPSPATDPANRLRESIQTLECPPPL
jgi:hypothetical protein